MTPRVDCEDSVSGGKPESLPEEVAGALRHLREETAVVQRTFWKERAAKESEGQGPEPQLTHPRPRMSLLEAAWEQVKGESRAVSPGVSWALRRWTGSWSPSSCTGMPL